MLTCKEENFLQRFVDGIPDVWFKWSDLLETDRDKHRDLFVAIKKEVLTEVLEAGHKEGSSHAYVIRKAIRAC